MKDYFVSFTFADKKWAEWIAHILEDAGKSVVFQTWDFRPGSNFVLEMQEAANKTERTIMVLSPDYLKSAFASSEWAAAFAEDPQGMKRKLVPVIVQKCQPSGLLAQIVHIDLVGLDPNSARETLLAGLGGKRAKPRTAPPFPGDTNSSTAAPSQPAPPKATAQPYTPKIRSAPTDVEKRRFLKAAFETVRNYFENALPVLAAQTRNLEFDFQPVTALEFTAEIFISGKSVTTCRIWQGGDSLSRDGIAFAEGHHHSKGSVNEVLSPAENADELALSSMMGGFGHFGSRPDFDLKNMTPAQAAEYLWRRFIGRLEH